MATFFEQRPHIKDREWQASVLWLNIEDDPGFGTLRLLTRKPKPKLVSLDLIKLLKKLPETSLALNVLRPLLVENEREVRENVVQWVENIRQATVQDANLEDHLISVLSQMIEQKFRTLNYEELSKMLRLTPFRETDSVKEVIKEERIGILSVLIQAKFPVSPEIMATIQDELQQLTVETLMLLASQLIHIPTIEQLEVWIIEHSA